MSISRLEYFFFAHPKSSVVVTINERFERNDYFSKYFIFIYDSKSKNEQCFELTQINKLIFFFYYNKYA